MSRITQKELWQLRNQIPILQLITGNLAIPTIRRDILRFRCPQCGQYDTATHQITNLARCFFCQRNYNTIELTMAVTGFNFRQSIAFLRPCLTAEKPDQTEVKARCHQPFTEPTLKPEQKISGTARREVNKIRIRELIKDFNRN